MTSKKTNCFSVSSIDLTEDNNRDDLSSLYVTFQMQSLIISHVNLDMINLYLSLRPQFWSSQLRHNKARGWNDMSLAETRRFATASYQL
jgi:hypothetical protein